MGHINLAELLLERVGSLKQMRFTNSGTEATRMAHWMARALMGRDLIVNMEGVTTETHGLARTNVGPAELKAGHATSHRIMSYALGLLSPPMDQVLVVPFNDCDAQADILEPMQFRWLRFWWDLCLVLTVL